MNGGSGSGSNRDAPSMEVAPIAAGNAVSPRKLDVIRRLGPFPPNRLVERLARPLNSYHPADLLASTPLQLDARQCVCT